MADKYLMSSREIRRAFQDFFITQGHKLCPSASLIPSDPTLLFTNAGMVPFKNVFLGIQKPPAPRAVSVQRCLRAGGKHNDLENVGYTARHHTFFEMLGNFSFGDYFKEQAIVWAFECITQTFGLDRQRLLVTVHDSDQESADLWRKISDFKVIIIANDDNFWSMGETGPCGPCTEIFYDHGDHLPGKAPPADGGRRFVEIWNLVFMQYQRDDQGKLSSLTNPGVDTGMGLERITAAMQGVWSNYDCDLFQPLIKQTIDTLKLDKAHHEDAALNVIADHFRACAFLIADGLTPSNNGRGYVLRRIIRRALRHKFQLHGQSVSSTDNLWSQLGSRLVAMMGADVMLAQSVDHVVQVLNVEEESFRHMLERGLGLLDKEMVSLPKGRPFPGMAAFKLYDTYGFPLDLTRDILRGKGLKLDEAGFEHSMEKQKDRARAAWSGSGDAAAERLWFDILDAHGATNFVGYPDQGYDFNDIEATILALIVDGQLVKEAKGGIDLSLAVDRTPFYAQSGGQEGDKGQVLSVDGHANMMIEETWKKSNQGGQIIHEHHGRLERGTLRVGDKVILRLDRAHRMALSAHHSATHLLHAALRQQLGSHVGQKGSLVSGDYLRLDVSHPEAIKPDELARVEKDVIDYVAADSPVLIDNNIDYDQAVQEKKAIALFGERYGDKVRVVSMGGGSVDNGQRPFSVELCGGTHVLRTGAVGDFVITRETAVGAGIRRIEAKVSHAAHRYHRGLRHIVARLSADLKIPADRLPEHIAALIKDKRRLEKVVGDLSRQRVLVSLRQSIVDIGANRRYAGAVINGLDSKGLRPVADTILQEIVKEGYQGAVVVIARQSDRAGVIVALSSDLSLTINAVDIVRAGVSCLGGQGGGGRHNIAQGGGTQVKNCDKALKIMGELLKVGG